MVPEPTMEETRQILHGLKEKYEAHHMIQITDEALDAAVRLSSRYIQDRFQPDKAIDVIDEASAQVRLDALHLPPEIKELSLEIQKLLTEEDAAFANGDYETQAKIKQQRSKLESEKEKKMGSWKEQRGPIDNRVDPEDIARVVSRWTGVPVTRLVETERERLLNLEAELHKRVIGQNWAVEAVAEAIRRSRSGLAEPDRPIGSFIFLGPTGVGKTELAKALAEYLFDDDNALVRVDMTEYGEKHSLARMIGSPPGYVGHEEGGQLTEAVRRRPFSVILMDEIEKAHPEVLNVLMQILDDGRLTDGMGRTVDFKNTIVIMTSNLGTSYYSPDARQIGFSTSDISEGKKKKKNGKSERRELLKGLMGELKIHLRPELVNRIDEIIVFDYLDTEELMQIVELMLDDIRERLAERNVTLELSEEAKKRLIEEGTDRVFGARPLRRILQREVTNLLSRKMLTGEISDGAAVEMDFLPSKKGDPDGGEFRIKIKEGVRND
jgi:ATP-dependent Clp protease ATP-binding subunit ClpC